MFGRKRRQGGPDCARETLAMSDDERTMERAVARLTERQRTVVRACLEAAAGGTLFDELARCDLQETLEAWPESVERCNSFEQVDGVMETLLDDRRPHRRWRELERYVQTSQDEIDLGLVAWRGLAWTASGTAHGNVDEQTMARAVARLDEDQKTLVLKCLAAATHGTYFDGDFHTLIGAWRYEAAATIAAWPEAAEHGCSFSVVNNVLNMLMGFPHQQWDELKREISATEDDVERAFLAWRGQTSRAAGGQGHFDSLM